MHWFSESTRPALSLTSLEEFKIIWKEEFGEDISDELALEESSNLLTLFDHIYKPIKKEWLKEADKNDFTDLPAP